MTLDASRLAGHLNMTGDEINVVGIEFVDNLLKAAKAHTESQLGFKLDDRTEFPDGVPADVEQAVLLIAAHWFGNREETITGTIITTIPVGAEDIIRNHRRWTFG